MTQRLFSNMMDEINEEDTVEITAGLGLQAHPTPGATRGVTPSLVNNAITSTLTSPSVSSYSTTTLAQENININYYKHLILLLKNQMMTNLMMTV